ncbi:MAG: HAD family hydrolase [Candidatus Levybacteria bacterium]|nr:HAD family hydrolase [Candidatus Levybacteria bacterium]
MSILKKAIFLDKDGTLIHNVHYNVDPQKIRLTDGAIEGLKKLIDADYELYIISNQQGVALNYFTEKDLVPVKEKIEEMVSIHGVLISGFYYCPHHTNDNCVCRKPQPKLIKDAAQDHNLDLANSWMIGDMPTDIVAGKKAGCKTIFFDNGLKNDWQFAKDENPDHIVKSLDEAADYILDKNKGY